MTLGPEELRAIELYKKYNNKDLNANLEDYHFFIDTLIYLHEALVEEKIEIKYWEKPSETLLHKFSFHGIAIHNILSGIKLSSKYYKEISGKTITDISSAKVIFRSQIEAFLMYHFIYVNPDNDDYKELRYNAWIFSALLKRQEFPANTEYGKKQQEKDLIEIEKMRSRIRGLDSFKNLTIKQQKNLIENGSGKLFNHWSTILKETGFQENHIFHSIYNHLSMYSHSEGISILQLNYQPGYNENVLNQANLDLHHSKFLICLMINTIARQYKPVANKFAQLPWETQYDINFYCQLAMKSTVQ